MANDLDQTANDLKESAVVINILMAERERLKDHFAIFNIEIRGLQAKLKDLQDALKLRDSEIEVYKRDLANALKDNERLKRDLEEARRNMDKRIGEFNDMKKQNNEIKGEAAKRERMIAILQETVNKLKKDLENLKAQNADMKAELEKVRPQLVNYRDTNKELERKVRDAAPELEAAKKKIADLEEQLGNAVAERKTLKKSNDDLTTERDHTNDEKDQLAKELKTLKAQTKDLKPDNDKLVKQVEDLNKNINDLLDENKKLSADPKRNTEDLENKIKDLTAQQKAIIDDNEKLKAELAQAKADLQSFMDERKKRNDERRAKKEERLKNMLAEAKKYLEESKKLKGERAAIVESAGEAQSVKQVRADLDKLSGLPQGEKGIESERCALLDEPIEEINVAEMPKVDIEHLPDVAQTMYERSGRPDETGGGVYKSTYTRTQGFRNGEPTEERAPRKTNALNKFSSKYPDFEEQELAPEEDPYCPYSHYRPHEDEKFTDFDLRRIVDQKLRNMFKIGPDKEEPSLLHVVLDPPEVNVTKPRHEEVIDEVIKMVKKQVDERGEKKPEDVVSGICDDRNKDIQQLYRDREEKKKVVPPPAPVQEEEKVKTPSGKGLVKGIIHLLRSKAKDPLSEFKKDNPATGKAMWIRTHFIFCVDCSGSMQGQKETCVKEGFDRCANMLKGSETILSCFTFDDAAFDCMKMFDNAGKAKKPKMKFNHGEKTRYDEALKKAIALMTTEISEEYKGYLTFLIFLSDGKPEFYPDPEVAEIKKLQAEKKIRFKCFAVKTQEEADMQKMTQDLDGDMFRVEDAEALKTAFLGILSADAKK